jgi:hypothetical protein
MRLLLLRVGDGCFVLLPRTPGERTINYPENDAIDIIMLLAVKEYCRAISSLIVLIFQNKKQTRRSRCQSAAVSLHYLNIVTRLVSCDPSSFTDMSR